MKKIPTSPRAQYGALRARVFKGELQGDSPADFDGATPHAEIESVPARGREELDVWLETCAALGLPLPDWTSAQKRQWANERWLTVDSKDTLSGADEYPNMARFVREQYGDSFVVVFEQLPRPQRL